MILLNYRKGRFAPVPICDICQQRITNAKAAAAVGCTPEVEGDDLFEVLHVHKGICHDRADAKLGGIRKTGWDELSVHLPPCASQRRLDAGRSRRAEKA